jgi:hypothetical protein
LRTGRPDLRSQAAESRVTEYLNALKFWITLQELIPIQPCTYISGSGQCAFTTPESAPCTSSYETKYRIEIRNVEGPWLCSIYNPHHICQQKLHVNRPARSYHSQIFQDTLHHFKFLNICANILFRSLQDTSSKPYPVKDFNKVDSNVLGALSEYRRGNILFRSLQDTSSKPYPVKDFNKVDSNVLGALSEYRRGYHAYTSQGLLPRSFLSAHLGYSKGDVMTDVALID